MRQTERPVVNGPRTDEDWTIHSLNIHGTFFERRCAEIIEESGDFKVEVTNEPVMYPPDDFQNGKESSLDIRASRYDDELGLTLIIECKKNNPEFVDWIFFPSGSRSSIGHPTIRLDTVNSPHSWTAAPKLKRRRRQDVPIVNEGRESRGQYSNNLSSSTKTKTSNAAISDAAYQVALATQSTFVMELNRSRQRGMDDNHRKVCEIHAFYPVIVTTANLFLCEFAAEEIDIARGEIPLDKAKLKRVNEILFDYSLPIHLQTAELWERAVPDLHFFRPEWASMQIAVVTSTYFMEFLHKTRTKMHEFL